jgi:hypothetical protein
MTLPSSLRLIRTQEPVIVSAAAVAKGGVGHTFPGSTVLAARSCSLVRVLDAPTRQRHHVAVGRKSSVGRESSARWQRWHAGEGSAGLSRYALPLRFLVIFE